MNIRKDRDRKLTLNDLHQLASYLQSVIIADDDDTPAWQGVYDALENKIEELTPLDGGYWFLEV